MLAQTRPQTPDMGQPAAFRGFASPSAGATASDMAIRNPAPDASPSSVQAGTYRVVKLVRAAR